jgi:hypothetical protein
MWWFLGFCGWNENANSGNKKENVAKAIECSGFTSPYYCIGMLNESKPSTQTKKVRSVLL